MYGDKIGTETTVEFVVQTNWPDTTKPDRMGNFSSYYLTAYTDISDPGRGRDHWFHLKHPELFDPSLMSDGPKDAMRFKTSAAALAVADQLRKTGRLTCGWEGRPWSHETQGELTVRVVVEVKVETRSIVK